VLQTDKAVPPLKLRTKKYKRLLSSSALQNKINLPYGGLT
jgi:hypothetical protein